MNLEELLSDDGWFVGFRKNGKTIMCRDLREGEHVITANELLEIALRSGLLREFVAKNKDILL